MLQNRSVVQVVDNTEVLEIRCFRPRGTMSIGDLVTGSVTKVSKDQKTRSGGGSAAGSAGDRAKGGSSQVARSFKRGDVVRAVIVNCRGKTYRRGSGRRTSFGTNTCVLRTHAGKEGWVPVGTRVGCAVPRLLRQKGWGNIVARTEHGV
jgi:ribosomal protein L14